MLKPIIYPLLALSLFQTVHAINPIDNSNSNVISLSVNLADTHQTIRNFGASDGFAGDFFGKYMSNKQVEDVAELLFSKKYDTNGNPIGIGLSAWRFNIGAGTYEQGDDSRIYYENRRTECFMDSNTIAYDWSKQAGQRKILELAVKKYDVPTIIGWQNSPPVAFTKHHLGFKEIDDSLETILLPQHYTDFGIFLANVVDHFDRQGIKFSYISPLNEPQWNWQCDATTGIAGQEGSPWTNENIHDVVSAINNVFVDRNIDTKLFITEAGSIQSHLSTYDGFSSHQLETFWGTGNLSVADLPTISNILSSHSYWSDDSAESIVNVRRQLKREMVALNPDLEYWQTEYSFMGNGYKFGHPEGRVSPINSAISLARIIHADLTLADASAWQWWSTFEDETLLDDEDRFCLIRMALSDDRSCNSYSTTKLLYALGNYSFFIRPGMKRISVNRSDGMDDYTAITQQMFSAYKDNNGTIVIVAINAAQEPCNVMLPRIELENNKNISSYKAYITSADPNDNIRLCATISAHEPFSMPASSILTFVCE